MIAQSRVLFLLILVEIVVSWTSSPAVRRVGGHYGQLVHNTKQSPSRSLCRRSSSPPAELSVSNENDDDDDGSSLKSQRRGLTKEFLSIGAPALIQLAAEPLAALVDTAYLGRLGPEVLGGAGVAVSAQYAVSKLYNDPLLRTSISLVAAQDGQSRSSAAKDEATQKRELSVAVSSALLLAGTVGILQMIIYSIFCNRITMGMGVTAASPMWHSAVSYLKVRLSSYCDKIYCFDSITHRLSYFSISCLQVRAFGTPAATLWLVANGIFRGLGDTKTPLIFSLLFTGLNICLDPLFIFVFGWGASGAAAGTALAQYTALGPLLWALNRKVKIDILGQMSQLKSSLSQYLKAGSLVMFRTVAKGT